MALTRPSTSGGLSTTDSAYDVPQRGASPFDKRMSKDDMYFSTAAGRNKKNNFPSGDKRMLRDDMYIRTRMAAMSQFHVPVRGSTITPQRSPDYPVAQEMLSIPVRMQTPESMTSGDIPIGMAIGSPVRYHFPNEQSRFQQLQQPAQLSPASPRAASPQAVSSRPATLQSNMSSEPSPGGSLQRKKTGRRKLFGLFGSKKNADGEAIPSVSTDKSSASRPPARSKTQSEKGTSPKPGMSRSNTMPQVAEDSSQMATAGPPHLQQGNSYHRQELPRAPAVPSLLNVQIPDTKLERYSVMFSDVLNPGGSKSEPAATLLARRQATLERLKSIDDRIEAEEAMKEAMMRPRRATSPQPQPSPRLSVFPTPPSNRTLPVIETPTSSSRVTRSNTSPGRLPSPTQPSFDRRAPPPAQVSTRNLTVPNPFEMHPPPSSGGPIYPTDTTFHFGHENQPGFVLIDSPTAMEPEEHDIIIAQPLKPTLHEPQWHMISPSTTSSGLSSASFSAGPRRSPSVSSASTHMTKPSTDSKFEEADAAFQNAVEVSIARQISISRQQRQLLRPLQTRRRTESGGGAAAAAAPVVVSESRSPLGVTVIRAPSPANRPRQESLREIQSSTPTLVHPRNSPVDPGHRKSSFAVVESD